MPLASPTYTQGTWTPTVTTDATVGTPAYSVQVGSYERIGRQVTARFFITLTSWAGSPTGNVLISGLPFTSANVTNDRGSCSVGSWGGLGTALAFLSGQILPNTSSITMMATTTASVNMAQMTAANLGGTAVLVGVAQYRV